jgi:hypothetical protein
MEVVRTRMLNPPIFVVDRDGSDMRAYLSEEDVTRSLEAIDVRRGEYLAYDVDGRLVRLGADRSRVTIELAEQAPGHAADLERALRNYLTAVGDSAGEDRSYDLPALVQKFLSKDR